MLCVPFPHLLGPVRMNGLPRATQGYGAEPDKSWISHRVTLLIKQLGTEKRWKESMVQWLGCPGWQATAGVGQGQALLVNAHSEELGGQRGWCIACSGVVDTQDTCHSSQYTVRLCLLKWVCFQTNSEECFQTKAQRGQVAHLRRQS